MTSKQSLPWEQGCSGSPTEATVLVGLLLAQGGRGWLCSLPASPTCSALILSAPQAPSRTGQPFSMSDQHRNLIVQEVTLICPLAKWNQSAHSAPGRQPAVRSPQHWGRRNPCSQLRMTHKSVQFSSVQSLSHVQLFATP